jgi:small subunit ribosomal protein S12
MTPKKPNSAIRKVVKVKLNKPKNMIVTAYIPGEKHSIAVHNIVLLRPGKTQDLPGVNYKVIRGPYDAKPPIRTTSRSKYGTPSSNTTIIKTNIIKTKK